MFAVSLSMRDACPLPGVRLSGSPQLVVWALVVWALGSELLLPAAGWETTKPLGPKQPIGGNLNWFWHPLDGLSCIFGAGLQPI